MASYCQPIAELPIVREDSDTATGSRNRKTAASRHAEEPRKRECWGCEGAQARAPAHSHVRSNAEPRGGRR
jgi:hypothetical protein